MRKRTTVDGQVVQDTHLKLPGLLIDQSFLTVTLKLNVDE